MRLTVLVLLASLSASARTRPANHENLNATLWAQTAVEHDAVHLALYRQAREQLDRALKDKKWTAAVEQTGNFRKLPPAIILDIDETVLDNSSSQARAVIGDQDFLPAEWDKWVLEAAARPLPGAVEFTRYAHSRGVTVFFVTNRDAKLEEATRQNMQRAGFPMEAVKGPATDTFLLRGEKADWGSDKGSRRASVARDYRVLMLLGDDLGDFLSNARGSVEERRKLVAAYDANWGVKWIPLPNAMYGSWEGAVYDHNFRLSREEKLERKFGTLSTRGDSQP